MNKILTVLILLSAISVSLMESIFFITTIHEKISYLLFFLFFSLYSIVTIMRTSAGKKNMFSWVAAFSILVSFAVPVISDQEVLPYYYTRDAFLTVSLFLIYLSSSAKHQYIISYDLSKWLVIFSVYCGICLIAMGFSHVGARFTPPAPFVFVFAVLGITSSSRNFYRLVFFLVALILLYLGFKSGQRTSVVLGVFALITGFLAFYRFKNSLSLISGLIVFAAIIPISIMLANGVDIESSRFSKLEGGKMDGSLLARYYESIDVVNHLQNEGALRWLFGFGFGAYFEPVFSIASRTLLYSREGEVVHHIHSTPVAVLYRHGLLGLWLYAAVFIGSFQSIFKSRKSTVMESYIAVSFFSYLLYGLFFDIYSRPEFFVFFLYYFHFSGKTNMTGQGKRI